MKKLIVAIFLLSSTPAFAWWDSYGGFTCGYMDPLTSFLDSIFGPPCPPPPVIVIPPVVPTAVAVPAGPVGQPRVLPPPPPGMPPMPPAPPMSPFSPFPYFF